MDRTKVGAEKKRLQVNSAALVDLKAALFRKQQEYKKEKSSSISAVSSSKVVVAQDTVDGAGRKVSDKTASVWLSASRKVKKKESGQGVNGRSSRGEQRTAKERSSELTQHEEEQLAKSRRALEAKAAIYERLSRGEGLREEEEREGEDGGEGEEGGSRYMVDFTRKVWEDHMNSQSPPTSPTSSKKKDTSSVSKEPGSLSADQSEEEEREPTPPPQTREEEWVEYVDSFGRSRSCLRKDLPEFMKMDHHLEAKQQERNRERNRSPTPELLSEDMRRERERKQWEQDAEEDLDLDKPIGPVHYQEVRGGEVRTHGAGYYSFSVDEERRREQIGLLNKLREQTTTQREKRGKLQEKRKALLEARLAKVRERKLKQKPEEANVAGSSTITQDIADFDFDKGQSGSTEKTKPERNEELSMLLAQAKEQAELEQERKEEEERSAHVRPWDRGKVVDPIKKKKQELRDERLNEFAPPSIYSSSSIASSSNSEHSSSPKRPKTDDSETISQKDDDTTTSTSIPGASHPATCNSLAASGISAPPFNSTGHGGYFYPPGNLYLPPLPFGVHPPPPGMVFAPPPPGGPYFAPPPPLGMGVAFYHEVPQPTVLSHPQMKPPPGLPPDLSN